MVEILVVIAIMVILAAVSFTGFTDYVHRQEYRVAVQEVFEATREARQETLGAEGDANYGVYFATDSVTIFSGDTYNASDPNNDVRSIYGATIDTNFSGGVDEVSFARLSGLPSTSGTVTVTDSWSGEDRTISISGAGLIEQP